MSYANAVRGCLPLLVPAIRAVHLRRERDLSEWVPELSRRSELSQLRLELGFFDRMLPRSGLLRPASLDDDCACSNDWFAGGDLRSRGTQTPQVSGDRTARYTAQARLDGAAGNVSGILECQLRGVSDVCLRRP